MDSTQLTNATAAWLDVWRHGSAHPTIVLASLRRLATQARDPQSRAAVERARQAVAAVPFGSVEAVAA